VGRNCNVISFFTLREVCNFHTPINRRLFPWLKQCEADHLVVRACMELMCPLSHTSFLCGAYMSQLTAVSYMRFGVPTTVYMMITPFSNAMLCHRWRGATVFFYEAVVSIFTVCYEDEDCMFLWSGGTYLPNCVVSHPRIQCIQLFSYLGILLGWAPLWLLAIVTEIVIVFLRLYSHVSENAATIALDFHCPLATHKIVSCPVLHT
jgi:hypothetical protein